MLDTIIYSIITVAIMTNNFFNNFAISGLVHSSIVAAISWLRLNRFVGITTT